MEQAAILMQDRAPGPKTVFVDLGYRGVEADNAQLRIVHRGKPKRLTAQEKRQLKRHQAIEPIVDVGGGHIKPLDGVPAHAEMNQSATTK